MSTMDPVELAVAEWLTDEAAYRLPDHLGEVVAATTATRQRAAWSSLERWLPMDVSSRANTLAPPRLGRVIVVVLVIAALVGLAILAVGSRPHRVPPPFGPARNGVLLVSTDGDIFSVDPATHQTALLVAGDAFDFGPTFSRDGTRFMFTRVAPADCGQSDCGLSLMVANTDGSGVRQLTPGLPWLDWADWSSDGSRIAIDSQAPDHGHVIDIVSIGRSGMRTLDVGRPAHELSWLPPNGDEIVFRGEHLVDGDPPAGIFAVRPDGSGLRRLTTRPGRSENDYQDVSVSPDGTRVGYRGDDGPDGRFVAHVLDLRSGTDRALPQPGTAGSFGPFFSPDGRTVAYQRIVADQSTQLVVAPADASSLGVALGSSIPFDGGGPGLNNCSWIPDGTAVVCNDAIEKVARLFPIDGSTPVDLAHGEMAMANYQRLAP